MVAFAVLSAAAVGYLALGMPGMNHSTDPMGDMQHPATQPTPLTPSQFSSRIDQGDSFVINVHTPVEGRIAGMGANIPHDNIVGDPQLPADQATPILLYCRTGRMSEIAGRALLDADFTAVAHLEGGMDAWVSAGFPLDA